MFPSRGYLLYLRRDVLLALPFDPSSGSPEGDPIQIASGVATAPPSSGMSYHLRQFFAADSGLLAYSKGEFFDLRYQLQRIDRLGNVIGTIGPEAGYEELDLFTDGARLAVTRRQGAFETPHVQIVDVARSVFARLNPGVEPDVAATPGRDGIVAYTYSPDGTARDLYARAASGVGEPRLLVASETAKHANDWSPDGRFLLYDDHLPGMGQDLFIVPREGGDPIPFLATVADESPGVFSPDGGWIAYRSDESGQNEVFVRDFAPDRSPAHGGEKIQISIAGGDKPKWSADGRTLYYLAPDNTLTEVPVIRSRPLEVGLPVPLFQTRPHGYTPYDVFPDGTFIVNNEVESDVVGLPIVVKLGWQQTLRR